MQSEELKPCPFCGGKNLRFRLSDIEGWIAHVECTDCDDMLGPMSEWKHDDKEDAEKDAAAVWNRRPCLEAVLSAAEPVAWRYSFKGGKWTVQKNKPNWFKEGMPDVEIEPLFIASSTQQPAPSVAVKALADAYKAGFEASSQGYNGEVFPEYEADNEWLAQRDSDLSALSAQVQEVAGDEEWQIVPKHPTGSMIEAVVSMVDDDAPHLFLLNLYRAMLAAAPAKQED